VSKAGTYLTDMIKKYYEEFTPLTHNKARIVLAKLGNDAGIYGAARLLLS
ncbi:MAG: ROK family protein, partial [Clostridium sp.]